MKILFLIILATSISMAQQPTIEYRLGMPKPSTHLFEVELTIGNIPASETTLDVQLPVWRPGRYMVMDFAGGVLDFSSGDSKGKALTWKKTEKSVWRVETQGAPSVTISYKVFANEFNLRTRGLNDEHGFVDGAAVFMYVEKYRMLPVQLKVQPYNNWHVTTGLEGKGNLFTAPDYDYFVDCPLEIGTQKDFSFEVEGIPHVLSIYGNGNWNADTLIRDITKIISTTKAMFGVFPYKRYLFLVHCTPSSGGGTEHINSTIMGTRPFVFSNPDTYRGFLGLVSHEYFHTWNVKQFRPAGITPYDFTKENYTGELWISEGTTSYYDEIILVRAGLKSADKHVESLAAMIQNDRQRPGNKIQSLYESSFDSWVKFSRGTAQAYNTESDFYDKGASVSMLLDLEIRNRTNGERSLEDVMRICFERFPLKDGGFTLDGFRGVIEEVSKTNFRKFFDDYIQGVKPLPWEQSLSYAGINVVLRDSTPKPWIGMSTSDGDGRTRITRVISGSPAHEAGLDQGDEIVAVNGMRARTSDINDRVSECKAGDTITLLVFRNDFLKEFTVTITNQSVPNYKTAKVSDPVDTQKKMYEGWLGVPWK